MISVITPYHKGKHPDHLGYLMQAYASINDQIDGGLWEWIIVINGDEKDRLEFNDPRIQVVDGFDYNSNIGALKNLGCKSASGDILLELDYDDMLMPDCFAEVRKAFEDPAVHMVYSNDALFINKTKEPFLFSQEYGWKHREFTFRNNKYVEMVAWPPSAHSFRRIEWSPDHVRCWRTTSYLEIGGHNTSLPLGDDHELSCRFYIAYGEKGIKHIDKCLYLYRILDKENSSFIFNPIIQHQTDQNYLKYSRAMAERWARDQNLKIIDLGGRFGCPEGYESVDRMDADHICDLNHRWPFDDNSVGVIRASHIIEHLKDPIHTMNEAFRVLSGGGWFFIDVPSTDGRGAFQDATHISFWNENSFWYYTQQFYAKFYYPEYKGRFQLSRITTWYPDEWCQQNNIPIVQADLICLKPPYSDRPAGEINI